MGRSTLVLCWRMTHTRCNAAGRSPKGPQDGRAATRASTLHIRRREVVVGTDGRPQGPHPHVHSPYRCRLFKPKKTKDMDFCYDTKKFATSIGGKKSMSYPDTVWHWMK